jgi:hypothetical protein
MLGLYYPPIFAAVVSSSLTGGGKNERYAMRASYFFFLLDSINDFVDSRAADRSKAMCVHQAINLFQMLDTSLRM